VKRTSGSGKEGKRHSERLKGPVVKKKAGPLYLKSITGEGPRKKDLYFRALPLQSKKWGGGRKASKNN